MPLDALPSTALQNNLRLPDALTVEYGPAPLLSRFVLAVDRATRQMGMEVRVRFDFDELLYLNRQEAERGNWYRLLNMFNPDYDDLGPQNAFWLAGYDEHGEIVATTALHVYDWAGTNLREQAQRLFYAREERAPCKVTAAIAEDITGTIGKSGAAWVRPDWRGKQLSHFFPRMGRAFGASRWPLDWVIGLVQPPLVKAGIATGYGVKHLSPSIFYPQSPWGDLEVVVAYTSIQEVYDDLTSFLADELPAWSSSNSERRTVLEHNVMKTSSELVFHGNSTRS